MLIRFRISFKKLSSISCRSHSSSWLRLFSYYISKPDDDAAAMAQSNKSTPKVTLSHLKREPIITQPKQVYDLASLGITLCSAGQGSNLFQGSSNTPFEYSSPATLEDPFDNRLVLVEFE